MTPLKKRVLTLLMILTATCAGAHAQSYNFTVFEAGGIGDPNVLTPINLNATLSQNGTSVDVTISNDSTPGDGWITAEVPTITKIAFDDDSGALPSPTFSNSPPDVEFHVNDSVNIPGSNNINFDTTYGFSADPPPTVKGIDPGEQFVINFGNTSLADVTKAMNSGDLRIGVHVQQIGKNDGSASFVSVVPEPSSALLLSLAGLSCLMRRKR